MRFLAMIVAVWAFVTPLAAQDSGDIEDVIGQQLEAFLERDVDKAWTFASPMIQGMFGNAGNFGMMVQQGYPMVWDNRDATFLEQETGPGETLQKVFIRDAQGNGWVLLYAMIATDAGWKINGVTVIPAPDVSA